MEKLSKDYLDKLRINDVWSSGLLNLDSPCDSQMISWHVAR